MRRASEGARQRPAPGNDDDVISCRSSRRWSISMPRLASLGLVAAFCLGFNVVAARAGPCTGDIAQIEAALQRPGSDVGPTLGQSIGAQIDRQPTPGSVKRAEARADARLKAALARARAFDARGNRAKCSKAVARIKLLIGMQ